MMQFKIVFVITFLLILNACGGKSSSNNSNAQVNLREIPICSKEKNDESKALKISKTSRITPLTKDTKVRVFHYSNNEKYVCVIKGRAILK